MILSGPKHFFDCNFTSCLIRYWYIVIANHFIHETHRLRKRFSFPFQMYKVQRCIQAAIKCFQFRIVEQEKAICFMYLPTSPANFYLQNIMICFFLLLFWSEQNVPNPLFGRNSRIKSHFTSVISWSHNNGTKDWFT